MDVLEILNQQCVESGICPKDNSPTIKRASELYLDGSPRRILISEWDDGAVTSCVVGDDKLQDQCCYSAERGGSELYFIWLKHLQAVGYKEQPLEVGE